MKNNLFKNSISMKKLLTKKLPITIGIKQKMIIACLLSMPIISNAQFNPLGIIGRTNIPIAKIGIGNFPSAPSVQAKLHLNSFLLAANVPTNGLLFRTDGDQSVVNQWQLFTGPTNLTTIEKFKLFVPANDSCVVIKSTTSSLILADNKTQISVEELKKMQEQIASLQQQLAILQKQIAELKK